MIQTGMKTVANANSISAISRSQETRRLGKEDLSAIAICIPSDRIVIREHHTVNAATKGSCCLTAIHAKGGVVLLRVASGSTLARKPGFHYAALQGSKRCVVHSEPSLLCQNSSKQSCVTLR